MRNKNLKRIFSFTIMLLVSGQLLIPITVDVKTTEKIEQNSSNNTEKSAVVTFNDPILEQAISDQLSVPVGEITVSDMKSLTLFNGNYLGIADLSDFIL